MNYRFDIFYSWLDANLQNQQDALYHGMSPRVLRNALYFSRPPSQRVSFQWMFTRYAGCMWCPINSLRPGQNGRHFRDILNAISWMKMNKFKLKFHGSVPNGPINNIPALVQIMAWRRSGDKPLCEPIMVSVLTHFYPSCGLNELTKDEFFDKYDEILAWDGVI